MSVLPKNLRSMNSITKIGLAGIRYQLIKRALMERSLHGLTIRDGFSRMRVCPRRILQMSPQAQQSRWNSDYYEKRSTHTPFSRFAAPPRRNNILAAQNAAKRRQYLDYNDLYTTKMGDMDTTGHERDNAIREVLTTGQAESSMENSDETSPGEIELGGASDSQYETQNRNLNQMPKAEINGEIEEDLRTVRETIFGQSDDNEDTDLSGYACDAELLKRVTAQKHDAKENDLSQKVSSPYASYNNHRRRWAEFRHGMIYGRSSF